MFKVLVKTRRAVLGVVSAALFAPGGAACAQVVTLRPAPDGVVAEYVLASSAKALTFADKGVVRTDWRAEAVTLTADGVTAPAPVTRFSLRLLPDTTEADRGYIALVRVGEGYVLYAPALAGEGMTLKLKAKAPAGWVLTPERDANGYVYLGPKSAVSMLATGRGRLITSPTVAPALRKTTASAFADAVAFYAARFGSPTSPPTLVVTSQGAGPGTSRGDVTDTGVISARFHGETWKAPSSDDLDEVGKFVFHETAHDWNSHTAKPREGVSWIHEGGAEYAAIVGAVSAGHLSREAALADLSGNLTGCRRRIGTRAPGAERMTGSGAYDCGVAVQWIADMELRRASNSKRSIFDVWASLIERARRGQVEYGPEDFRALLTPDTAVILLLDGPGDRRWAEVESRLSALGVNWTNRPSRQDLVTAALSHLNRQNCKAGSSTGFYIRNGGILMDNAETCGPLSGGIGLAKVEGFDPLAQTAAMFDAVQARCAAGEAVTLTIVGSDQTRAAACAAPLATPVAYSLTQAPDFTLPFEH